MGKTGVRRGMTVGLAGLLAAGVAEAQPRYRVRYLDTIDQGHRPEVGRMNDGGVAVGLLPPFAFDTQWGIVWERNGSVRLPGMEGMPATSAYDINGSGQIAGFVAAGDREGVFSPIRAAIWDNGQPRLLPTAEGMPEGFARVINNNGDAAGAVWSTFPEIKLAFWHDGQATLLGASGGAVTGLNGRRQIVGNTLNPANGNLDGF